MVEHAADDRRQAARPHQEQIGPRLAVRKSQSQQPSLNEIRGDAFRRPANGPHQLYPVYSLAIACVTT